MKKYISLILFTLVVISLFAGCGSTSGSSTEANGTNSDGKVKISVAVFETDNYTADFWKHIFDSFEKDNPDIAIEKVLMTGDSRPQFLKTLMASGNFPDVNIDPVELSKIDGIYAEVPTDLLSKFEDTAKVKSNGKNVLIPAYKAYRGQVYYNKKQFDDSGIKDVPKTWDEFLEDCEKLKAKGYVPLITGGSKDIWATGSCYWTGVANSEIEEAYPNFNSDVLSGKVKWNNPVVKDVLTRWQDLNKKGYFHKGSMSYGYTQASAEFIKGSAAMMFDGGWLAPSLDKANNNDIGAFVMPAKTGVKSYCTMPQYWAVSNTSKHKDAAFKFCEYVLGGNKEIYKYYLQADGTFPVTKDTVTYDLGPLQTKYMDNYKGYKEVPEITKVVGDNSLPTGWEDFQLKSLQKIFVGADISQELDSWDAEQVRLQQASKQN